MDLKIQTKQTYDLKPKASYMPIMSRIDWHLIDLKYLIDLSEENHLFRVTQGHVILFG